MRISHLVGLSIMFGALTSTPASSQTTDEDSASVVLPPSPVPRPILHQADRLDREPDRSDTAEIVRPPDPVGRPDFASNSGQVAQQESATAVDPRCHNALAAAGAVFETRGRIEGEGQCGVDDAVALQAINDLTLQPAALIACPTARTFTAFIQDTLVPRAHDVLGAAPTRVYIAASYACRGRNNVEGARLSEHGFGRAVDVRALDLSDGRNWYVRPHASDSEEPAARFQAALREEACGPFNTVLGPGSDGHHGDHLHFDTADRSSSYCR